MKKTLDDITKNITVEQVADLLSTAFYGGITYWCKMSYDKANYAEVAKTLNNPSYEEVLATMLFNGELLTFKHEDGTVDLTLEKLKRGIQLWTINFKENDEFFEVDAEGADIIIQLSLFEEIIYG